MRISATMSGMTNFERSVKRLTNRKTYELPLAELVKETAELARRYAPRDTGDLESSIRHIKIGTGKFAVIADVPYASFMEFGTRYFPVGSTESPRARTSTSGKACFHPFLRPAAWQMMNQYPQMVKKILFGSF